MPLILAGAAAMGVKGKPMKYLAWGGVLYSVLVGAATFYSGAVANSTTSDSIAALPSIGSLAGSTGTMAGVLDLATAGAIWFFVLK
jgi:hypothetical protein